MLEIETSKREPELKTVPFGKYKGRPISDLRHDQKYVAWLLTQPQFQLGMLAAEQNWFGKQEN